MTILWNDFKHEATSFFVFVKTPKLFDYNNNKNKKIIYKQSETQHNMTRTPYIKIDNQKRSSIFNIS